MSDSFWKKLSHVAGLIAVGALFALAVFAANVEVKDLDLWLHLKMGEHVVSHHQIPDKDILSCSIAGKPWVNHEWLFQSLLYLVFHQWGADGLIFLQVLVVTFTLFVLLLLGYQREKQFSSISILLLVMLVYQLRFTIRPDILSLLFFALYIYFLAFRLGSKGSLWALGIIQILWSNVHGFFFFGPLLVLIGIISELIKRHVKLPWQWNQVGRLTNAEYQRLKVIFLFVILASFVNPQGPIGAWYPISVLFQISGKSRIFFEHIQELQRPIHWSNLFSSTSYPYYKLLILISSLGFFFNRRKIDIGDFFVWLLFLLFSLAAIRNMVFFAFAAYLVCMTNFVNLSLAENVPIRFTHKRFQYITTFFLKVLLIVWMLDYGKALSYRSYFDFDKYEMKSEFGGITQRSYPTKAVDFLEENHIKGNFFNDFNSGAYLIGRRYPDIKVFIDGRTEVYGPDFFKEYMKIWNEGNMEAFKKAVHKYNLTGAFLNAALSEIPEDLLSGIYKDKEWVPVYFDYDAVVFLKDVPQNKDWIDRLRLNLPDWKAKTLDLKRLGARRVTPYQNINRAYSLEALGLNQAAIAEIEHALKISPGYLEPYKLLGKIYGKLEDNEKAFENFRIAAMIAPMDSQVRSNLGLAYERLKDFANAKKQYEFVIKYDSKNPKSYFMLAKVYALNKEYAKVLEPLKVADTLIKQGNEDFLKLGDILYEAKEYKLAKDIYEMALAKKDSAKARNKLGLCLLAMGLKEEAREAFLKGIALDPTDKELKDSLKKLDLK